MRMLFSPATDMKRYDATTPIAAKNMPMMGPPQQVLPIFSARRKDMASDDGSAAPENSLRPTALIAAKPPEGRFSTSPQLLKLWNRTAAAVKIGSSVASDLGWSNAPASSNNQDCLPFWHICCIPILNQPGAKVA
jgi:hypothetical protein